MAVVFPARRNVLRNLISSFKQILHPPNSGTRLLSSNPVIRPAFASQQSQHRKQVALANLLRRYGFPPSQVPNLVSKNLFLLKVALPDIDKSLGVLSSFKIPQEALVSLVCDCPGVLNCEFFRKWQVGSQNFRDSGVSPLVITKALELSGRFQVEPDGFFRSVKILKGLGFNSGTVNKILEGFPRIVMIKESEICKRIEFLMGIGFAKEGIERLVYVFPGVLGIGVEDRLKPLLCEFTELGFSANVFINEILREPKILGMEVGELSRCLELLNSLKCRVPIKEEILSEGEFRAGFEVKLRVDCLCKHGLIRREAFKILWKESRIITYKIEDIDKKIKFLVNQMKYPVADLAEVPQFLGVNFDKQIVPRYNVIKYLRSKGWLDYDVGLRNMIKLSRKRFYNFYVKPYPACEKMFGRFVEVTDLTRKQHPAGLWKLFKPPKYPESDEDVKGMKLFVESLV